MEMADDQLSTGLSMINLALAGPAVDAGVFRLRDGVAAACLLSGSCIM